MGIFMSGRLCHKISGGDRVEIRDSQDLTRNLLTLCTVQFMFVQNTTNATITIIYAGMYVTQIMIHSTCLSYLEPDRVLAALL